MIEKYDILDQVNVISFKTEMLTKLKEILPALSVGYLTSTLQDDESDPNSSIELILKTVQTYESTYNPTYNKGALGVNLLTAASHRGITIWPWTINEKVDLDTYFRYATYGLTTNYSQYVSNCLRTVWVDEKEYIFESLEEMASLQVMGLTYDRTEKVCTKLKLIFLEGENVFYFNSEGKLEASAPGTATIMVSVSASSPSGSTYRLCTQPFVVRYKTPESETTEQDTTLESVLPSDSDSAETTASGETTAEPASSGCRSSISAPVWAILLVPITGLIFRRKEDKAE